MAKKLIDANVILRYLLRDEATLFQKASALLEKVKTGEDKVVIL
jgi:predicted nucleic acid-binding protein